MKGIRITKRAINGLKQTGREFTVWDNVVTGFGVRVRSAGAMSYVVVYRAGAGRGAPARRYTIGAVGKITPERARARAKIILGAVAHGQDPASEKASERGIPTVAEMADRFMTDHVLPKRKAGTAEFYRDILDRIVKPAVGTAKSDKLTRIQVGRLHSSLSETPFQANRMLAVVGSMYAFAGHGFLSHLHSLMVTMSQKSSVPQAAKSVSQALMSDRSGHTVSCVLYKLHITDRPQLVGPGWMLV